MPARRRRSLSQQNLANECEGALGTLLADALTIPRESAYRLTHGFHPYPGRFHPRLARTVLEELGGSPENNRGRTVLDPFMGGGTTLVEGNLLGLDVVGNDLNPVAGLVARERTRPRTADQARRLVGEAERIAALVEALRREKHPPRVRRPGLPRLAPHYAPHLFAELVQCIRLIDDLRAGTARETLRAVFSALAVKFSNRRSDSSEETEPPRYPKGAVIRFLVSKCRELAEAQVTLGERLPRPRPGVTLLEEDARLLPSLGWGAVDLILTSPPYPGTYDYHEHHRLRMDWLELDGQAFFDGETGPRRGEGVSWSAAMRDAMVAFARVMKREGHLFVVIADWLDRRHAVDGAAITLRIAKSKGWRCESRASVQRAVHNRAERTAFAKRGKWEHLLHFRRI